MTVRRAAHSEATHAARRRALDVVLPNAEETLLLRALLWTGSDGSEAWREWRDEVGVPSRQGAGLPDNVKALLPLLHCALRNRGGEVDGGFASYARAAYVREELRGQAYRRILAELLDTAGTAGVRPIVLGGQVLADTVYPNPESRHSHGIRLLIRSEELDGHVRLLGVLEYQAVRTRTPGVLAKWTHPSGLPIELRTHLLAPPHSGLTANEVYARSVAVPHIHPNASMLCPEDELLRTLGQAAISPSRHSLRWACDAWLLIDRYAEQLDWSLIRDRARKTGLSLAISVALGFLTRELRANVPTEVLASVEADAGDLDDFAMDVAILGALPGSAGRMMHILRTTPGLRQRLALLRTLIFPSPAALRATRPDGPSVPLAYLMRPLGFIGRQALRMRLSR